MSPRRVLAAALAASLCASLSALPAAAAAKGGGKSAKGKKPPPDTAAAAPEPTPEEAEAGRELEAAGALFEAKKYDEALPHLEHARDLAPGLSGPYRALGITYKHLDRLEDARAAFSKYVEIKATGDAADAARAEIAAIDEELAKRAAEVKAVSSATADDKGAGGTAAPGAAKKSGGGFGPLRITGLGVAVAGAGALAVGIFLSSKWLGARSHFSDEFDLVRESLSVEDGAPGTLYVCDDADYAYFTPDAQTRLETARSYCAPMRRYRILGPVLAAGGLVFVGAGVALLIAGGGGGGKSGGAAVDPYAVNVPGLGAVHVDLALAPGGLLLAGTARF
jgi:tetratricopeptide (TPR) repeat protein